ncbi:MAG: hypothetical protein U0610_19025 [bacterium]
MEHPLIRSHVPIRGDHAVGILGKLQRGLQNRIAAEGSHPVPKGVRDAKWYLDDVTRRSLRRLENVGYRPTAAAREKWTNLSAQVGMVGRRVSRGSAIPRMTSAQGVNDAVSDWPEWASEATRATARLVPLSWDAPVRGRRSAAFAEVMPTQISIAPGAIIAIKEAWVPDPPHDVLTALDPRTWPLRSVFFEHVEVQSRSGRDEPKLGAPWSGRILETFVLNWNTVELARFETFLDVDITRDESSGRLDYRLAFEKNGALVRDDGFILIDRPPSRPGWLRYLISKTVWFSAAELNLLTPAVLTLKSEEKMVSFLSPVSIEEMLRHG